MGPSPPRILGFIVGYVAARTVAGLSTIFPLAVINSIDDRPTRSVVAMAFGWDCWRADRDCILFRMLIGRSCALSCWAITLVLMLTSPSPFSALFLAAMGIVMGDVVLPEIYRSSRD